MDNFFEQQNYLLDIDYLINVIIREYDISKANINALLYTNRISIDQYKELYNMPKLYRERQVGYMIRADNTIYNSIKEGISLAKDLFAKENNIVSGDVLAIKNDALFLINRVPRVTEFNISEDASFIFKLKNLYTSYYRYKSKGRRKLEFYYGHDKVHNIDVLDVKGISDSNLELHKNYFLDFLSAVFYSAQNLSIENTFDIIKNFYNMYISLDLDLEYYRSFNDDSCFYINQSNTAISRYMADHLPNTKDMKSIIDISYNLDIIMYLQKVFSNLYFAKNKY